MPMQANPKPEWAGIPIWDFKSNSEKWSRYLIWILFFLLIFEGSLRKWVFPQYHRYLFFIRDPFLILLYFLNLNIFMRFLSHPAGKFFTLMTIFPIISMPFQAETQANWYIFFFYGYRNYCLYIPLPFFIANLFSKEDLKGIVSFTLALTIPVAILTYIQSLSPPTAAINQGFGTTPDEIFGSLVVSQGFYRTAGTFTSIEGQVYFIGMLASILFSVFISREVRIPRLLFWVFGICSCSILAVSGSRTAFSVVFIVLLTSLGAAMFVLRKSDSLKAFVAPLIFALISIFLGTFFFQVQMGAFQQRVLGVAEKQGDRFLWLDDLFSRVSSDVETMSYFLGTSPLAGYGFGSGGNAGWIMGAPVLAEFPIGRHVIDLGPFLGPTYYLFRLWWIYFLGGGVLLVLKKTNNPFPLFYLAVVGVIFSWGQLTNQGSALGFGWILSGFCLAYCVQAAKEERATHHEAPAGNHFLEKSPGSHRAVTGKP